MEINSKLSGDLEKKLDDLLRTYQKGWSREHASKTLEKLKFLSTLMDEIVDNSFSDGTQGGISKDNVEKWMFNGEENQWLGESNIKARDKEGVKATTHIMDLKPVGTGKVTKNVFIHVGKVTDLNEICNHTTRTKIVLRADPALVQIGRAHV